MVVIDDSRSITPDEQVIVREATMLLADLADVGDRISVVTFGNGARVAISRDIQSDADRRAFKADVRSQVRFQDQKSDIAAGLGVVRSEESRLFRPPGASVRVPIVLSDGKLEPAGRTPQQALDQLVQDLKADTFKGGVYAIALGKSSALQTIPGLNAPAQPQHGRALMQSYVASSPDRFRATDNLDQLLGIAVAIFGKTKGVGSIGDKADTEYRIDDTVEQMSFIVRKAKLDEHGKLIRLCDSSDIELHRTGGAPLTAESHEVAEPGSVLWSTDYAYFDLIVVRRPTPGNWKVALRSGGTPEVLSKVVSPIELRVDNRDKYYLNEIATITAWLYDRGAGISRSPYEVRAEIAPKGAPATSSVSLPLRRDEQTGQFALTVPAPLQEALNLGNKPTEVDLELVATKPRADDPNEWFRRSTPPFTVRLVDGFIDWDMPPAHLTQYPFQTLSVRFGGVLDRGRAPSFGKPPELTLSVEKLDEDSNTFRPIDAPRKLPPTPSAKGWTYQSPHVPVSDEGTYRYAYLLEGATDAGAFRLQSPWHTFRVMYCWWCLVGGLAVVLLVLQFVSDRTATLKGFVSIELTAPGKPAERKRIDASPPRRVLDCSADGCAFTLQARRVLFVWKRIRFVLKAGKATVDGQKQLAAQGHCNLTNAPHKIRVTLGDGREARISLAVQV